MVIGGLITKQGIPNEFLRLRTGEDARGYLWRWLVSLEFLDVQVLDEIYAGRDGKVEYLHRAWVDSGGEQTFSEDGGG